VLTLFFL
jgi:hypothetical protein